MSQDMLLSQSLKLNINTLRIFGFHSRGERCYGLYSIFVCSVLLLPTIILEGMTATFIFSDKRRFAKLCYLLFGHVGTTIKFIALKVKDKKIVQLLESIDKVCPYYSKESEPINRDAIRHVRWLTISFIVIARTCLFFIILAWFMDTQPKQSANLFLSGSNDTTTQILFVDCWIPFDYTDSLTYVCLNVLLGTTVVLVSEGTTVSDTLISGIVHLISIRFDILKLQFAKFGKDHKCCKEVHRDIQTCVDYHTDILDTLGEFSSCFNVAIFTQIMQSVLLFCITIIDVQMSTTIFHFFSAFTFLICVVFQLFLYCHYGNEITSKSADLVNALYLLEWNQFECKCPEILEHRRILERIQMVHTKPRIMFQRNILLIIQRAQMPLQLQSGIFNLSYSSFISILKAGYSYYTFLNGVQH